MYKRQKEDTEKGFYMPVQRVCRPNHEFRGFQGQIENGAIRAGDLVTTLPSKMCIRDRSGSSDPPGKSGGLHSEAEF